MPVAITRQLSPAIARCELTHLVRQPIDVGLALLQHEEYERCLAELGCQVISLAAVPDLPDAVFVEDTAVVVDELAVMSRPGAVTRRSETATVAAVLARYRQLRAVEAPGTLDGGDVLRLGRRVLVGQTPRTNREGIEQLRGLLAPLGYHVEGVAVTGCLHLKSAVTQVAEDAVLLNPSWVDPGLFPGARLIRVDEREPHAANALLLGDTAMFPAGYPRTAARLEAAGVRLRRLDMSELVKAESGVTCSSIILSDA